MADGFSIGRLQAGLAHLTQEVTVAAAKLNFDFTLVKLEAPVEYQAIGNLLTSSRVRNAESGPLHVTARKLGALFEGFCPHTPNLIKAYGLRTSEISRETLESDAVGTSGRTPNWIRSEYGGIDATSIWAAATSSKAALPVHLLACIIARMWTPAEATSVWVEIIAGRKAEIVSRLDDGGEMPAGLISAVQQEITREHLSSWDASARAWLLTADKARQKQYKQFLLIIKNLSIAIRQDDVSLYSNVTYVWKAALEVMENLISGKPHVVREGHVLLGLSAWHIYPDMIVFNSPSAHTEIPLDDTLVKPGGILSLGISDSSVKEEQGVYWSLSLSHHKYYGDAVRKTRRLDVDGSRLSMDELVLVCLGSLTKCWSIPTQGVDLAFAILQELTRVLPLEDREEPNTGWRKLLQPPLKSYREKSKEAMLAVSLGRRRSKFLPHAVTNTGKSFFGFLHLSTLLFSLKGRDSKIQLLRRIAARTSGLDNGKSVILCFDDASPRTNHTFTTVLPTSNGDSTMNRSSQGTKYHRWIETPGHLTEGYLNAVKAAKDAENKLYRENPTLYPGIATLDPDDEDMCKNLAALEALVQVKEAALSTFDKERAKILTEQERELKESVSYLQEDLESYGKRFRPWNYDGLFDTVTSHGDTDAEYVFLFGQRCGTDLSCLSALKEHAALYVKESWRGKYRSDISRGDEPIEATLEDVLWCFNHDLIDPERLKFLTEHTPVFSFLKVLAATAEAYTEPAAGGGTITCSIVENRFDPPIFSRKLEREDWLDAHKYVIINRTTVIALIGYFETAHNVIDGMKGDYNIIGLSGGDSIFVLTAILNDPFAEYPDYSFTRILGNTGRPGFSILTSPTNLLARKLNLHSWRVGVATFDGKAQDHFQRTSLHLGFTDWQAPLVQVQSVGQRDSDVNIIEAVVSVRDAGKWVADVDVYQALINRRVERQDHKCSHDARESLSSSSSSEDLWSIETWDQVLDCVDGSAVVRCFDNWVARLAVLAVLCQHNSERGRQIVICPKTPCWECYAKTYRRDVTYIY